MTSKLSLYGREYCSLCQQMRDELLALVQELDFTLDWIDIDDDDALEEQYGQLVPALVGEAGELICFYHLSRSKLGAYLSKIG